MINDYIDCDDCIYQLSANPSQNPHCRWRGRLYETCEFERQFGNCSKLANGFAPKEHDPQVDRWQELCENCTQVLTLLFDHKKAIESGLTVGEVREKYACLGGDCPDLKTFRLKND